MATRQDLLQYLWTDVINLHLREDVLDNIIQNHERNPDGPFGNSGAVIKRLLSAGVSRQDLSQAFRSVAYEAVFATLYALDDPGVDDNNVFMLHEDLLSADPSGLEGRSNLPDSV